MLDYVLMLTNIIGLVLPSSIMYMYGSYMVITCYMIMTYEDYFILFLFEIVEGMQIKEQPQTWDADKSDVKLTVDATGLGILSYKWLKDREDIDEILYPNCSGVDTATLTITPFSSEYEGSYSCLVKDEAGQEIESNPINVKGTLLKSHLKLYSHV